MNNFSRQRTGSFPPKQPISHYPSNYKSMKDQLDRQTTALLNDRRNLELRTPINSQYNFDNKNIRPQSLKTHNSPKSQISEKIQEIVKLCGDDKQQLRSHFQQMTDAEKRILDLLTQNRYQGKDIPTNMANSYGSEYPPNDYETQRRNSDSLRQRVLELFEENKKLRNYVYSQGESDGQTKYLRQQIAFLEKKLQDYENQINKMQMNGQINLDLKSLYDQCEVLRQDTIYLLKDENNENVNYENEDMEKTTFLKDLQKLKSRLFDLQEQNRMLKGGNHQRKSNNTYTTRFSPVGDYKY